jgi:hypothetical protein
MRLTKCLEELRLKRFPQSYSKRELARLVIFHRDVAIAAKTELSAMRDKLEAAQRQLSEFKRVTRDKETAKDQK